MNDDSDIGERAQEVLLRALDENDASAVRRLMSSGVDPDTDIGIECTPLVAAAMGGQLEVTKALIEAGANVNLADNEGETALSLVLAVACNPSDEEDDGADEDEEANAAFWQQVFSGPHVQIARLLMQAGARADTTNDFTNRFFMVCCSQGSTELVKMLLDYGADVDARDAVNMTPLMYATSQPEIFKLLLDRGADVNIECDLGITVLDSLLCEKRLELAQLVVDHGGDVTERNYYLTRAASDGELDVVKFLLRNGTDPNRKNDEGDTPSHLAQLHGHREIALLLREARGMPSIDTLAGPRIPQPTEYKAERKHGPFRGLFKSSRKKNFRRDDKEIFLRSWWLAHKVTDEAAAIFTPTAISSWIDDQRFLEQDQKFLFEILGYTMSFVLERLRDEIEVSHGWTDDTYDLHMGCQVSLGCAFNQVFGFTDESNDLFVSLLGEYYGPEYDDGYDDFWTVCSEPEEVWGNKTFGELLNEPLSEADYNVERYYVYRLSKMVNVVDPGKVIENILPYQGIGLAFYDKAFFGLSLRAVKKELKQMINR